MSETEKLAQRMADIIGHNMAEKCVKQATIASEYYAPKLEQLKAENEALKASMPQVKHDAIMEAVEINECAPVELESDRVSYSEDMRLHAQNILTQAQEQDA